MAWSLNSKTSSLFLRLFVHTSSLFSPLSRSPGLLAPPPLQQPARYPRPLPPIVQCQLAAARLRRARRATCAVQGEKGPALPPGSSKGERLVLVALLTADTMAVDCSDCHEGEARRYFQPTFIWLLRLIFCDVRSHSLCSL